MRQTKVPATLDAEGNGWSRKMNRVIAVQDFEVRRVIVNDHMGGTDIEIETDEGCVKIPSTEASRLVDAILFCMN